MADQNFSFANLAPVSKAEAAQSAELAAGGVPAPAPTIPPEAPAPVPAAPAAIPAAVPARRTPRYVGGPEREGSVPILSPIEDFAGVVWDEIPLRRPSSREVGEYFERLAEVTRRDPEESLYYPVFAKPDGTPVPDEVLRHLDDDDRQRVMARAVDFLPLRLLALLDAQQPASTPTAGASIEPTSST